MILSPPTQQALNCWVVLSLHIWSICTVSRQRKPALWIQDVWVTANANVFINAVRCRVKSQHNIAQVFSVIICVVLVSRTNVPCITDFEGHTSVWTERDGIHVDTWICCLFKAFLERYFSSACFFVCALTNGNSALVFLASVWRFPEASPV